MNLRTVFIALSLWLLAIEPTSAGPVKNPEPEPMPSFLLGLAEASAPFWVEASKAIDESGRARVGMLGRGAIGLQKRLDQPSAGTCLRFEPVDIAHIEPPPRETLDQAVEHSRTRILARVTNKAFGFKGDIPGQVLQVVPTRTFGKTLSLQHYYLFIPVGEFLLGDRLICAENTAYAEPPEVGSEVFLFLAAKPWGVDENLLTIYGPGDIVPVARDGSLVLPEQYLRSAGVAEKATGVRHKGELLARLEQLFVEGVRR